MKELLVKIEDKNNKLSTAKFKKSLKDKEFKNKIEIISKKFKIENIDSNLNILYYIIKNIIKNDLKEIPKCICGKNKKFFKNNFLKTCGNKECINKIREMTNIEKYNVKNVAQKFKYIETKEEIEKRLLKAKETMIKNYGDIYILTDEFKEKSNKTKIKNNSFNNGSDNHLKNKDKINKEYFEKFIYNSYFDFDKAKEFYNCKDDYLYKKLNEFNIDYKRKAKTQYEIYQYIKSIYNGKILLENKIIKPFEIDIYLPDIKLAIEYNGLLWHSYGTSYPNNIDKLDENYHLRKTELCNEQDIRLIHIFEDKWLQNKDFYKDIIYNTIYSSIYNKKIKLEINLKKEINIKYFIEKYSFYNYKERNYKTYFYNNELVLVTFIENNELHFIKKFGCSLENIIENNKELFKSLFKEKFKLDICIYRKLNNYKFKQLKPNKYNFRDRIYFDCGYYLYSLHL